MEDRNMLIEIFCVNTVSITGPFCNAHKDVVLVQVIDSLEICHTVLQTSYMMGIEILKYFQTFFRKFDEDYRDFKKMMLGQLTID
jgi:hypothetical protein